MRLIDADALARAIKAECNPYGKPTIDFESGKKVLKIIDNAPTITPEKALMDKLKARPEGKWKEATDGHGHSSYFCSRCGTQEGKPYTVCPNCKADMRGDV